MGNVSGEDVLFTTNPVSLHPCSGQKQLVSCFGVVGLLCTEQVGPFDAHKM